MSDYNNLIVEIYTSSTTRIADPADELAHAQNLTFTTTYPGGLYGTCSFYVPREVVRTWAVQGAQRLVMRNGLQIVWEGKIDDLETALDAGAEGVRVTANGYWGTLMARRRWRKRWADDRLADDIWQWDTTVSGAEKCNADRDNRLRFTPRSEAWTSGEYAALRYTMPTGETIKRVVCNYDLSELGVFVPVGVKHTNTLGRMDVDGALDDNTDDPMENTYDADTGTSYTITMDTGNTLYVGTRKDPSALTNVQFNLGGSINNNPSILSAQYSSHTGWSALAITDNTKFDFGGGNCTLAQDGTVTFTAPQDWDKKSVLGQSRYWIRFTVSANCDAVSILDFVDGLLSDVADGGTVTLTADDYLYIGHNSPQTYTGIRCDLGGSVNNNVASLACEYFSGETEEWATLGITDGTAAGGATLAIDGDLTFAGLVTPDDLERTSVDDVSAYWIRLKPSADLDAVTFTTIRVLGQQQWELRLRDTVGGVNIWSATGSGTGSRDDTLGTPRQALELQFLARADQTPSSDGAYYGEVSGLMVYSETGNINLTEIAKDIRAEMAELNSDEQYIASNALALAPFVADRFETMADILTLAAGYGDSSYNSWHALLIDSERAATPNGEPVLKVEQRPALTDYDYAVRLDEPNLQAPLAIVRTTAEIWNWIIVEYTDARGWTQYLTPDDDADLTDATSSAAYGQRDAAISVGEADITTAENAGRRHLARYKDPQYVIVAPVTVAGYVRTKSGARVPASQIQAGKRLKVENYLTDLSGTGLTLLISQTQYDDARETCAMSFGPLPDLILRHP